MGATHGTNTMMPHRPHTTDGTTASRSTTYTIGCAQRRGTTSVSSSAMDTLTGTEMMIAISEAMTVPYRKAIAPNWLVAGFQTVEKMPLQPAVLNQDVDCCAVETTIRIRMMRTSRPETRARSAKARSPSGRACESGRADPAGVAGPALVTALMVTRRS